MQTQNAQDDFERATQALQPAMTGEGRGANIRQALEVASDGARDVLRRAWEPLNNSGARVDPAPLANDFEGIRGNLSMAEERRFNPAESNIPRELAGPAEAPAPVNTGLLDEYGAPITRQPPVPDTTAPINEITDLRSAHGSEPRGPKCGPHQRGSDH